MFRPRQRNRRGRADNVGTKWWLGAVLPLILWGCSDVLDSGVIPGALVELESVRFSPPAVYRTWWRDVLECTGWSADFDRLSFFEVTHPLSAGRSQFPCPDAPDQMCYGFWQEPHDIFLSPVAKESESIVKHEMLHDVRQDSGHRHWAECTK